MVSIRVWLKEQLTDPADTPLRNLISERVYPRESFDSSRIEPPYLVFGLGNSTGENLAEDPDDFDLVPQRQFFQVWVHDEMTEVGGSYLTIDDIIPLVIARLHGKSSMPYGIINITYLETSGEFSNQSLKTVFRYIRFQAVLGKVTS